MARGQAQAADAQLAKTNAAGDRAGATGSGIFGVEMPVVTNQLQNPGYDPKTADAIRRSGMDATNSAFDAAKFSAAQRAGATGNDAAFYSSQNDLAQKRGQQLATGATNAEVKIGDAALQDRQKAISEATGLYGISQDTMSKLYGMGPGTLGARAAGPSGDQGAQGWVNSAIGVRNSLK